MNKKKRLHFLLIYPLNVAPSQRFRFEQFFPLINTQDYSYDVNCFYDETTYSYLYKSKGKIKLVLGLVRCFLRRCYHMFFLSKYDYILIQRGAAPLGPPVFEWIIKFICRKPIIYDFDDAIWRLPEENPSVFKKIIKSNNKVRSICKWANKIVVGNRYLAEYASRYNMNVIVIPTVVDTDTRFVPKSKITEVNNKNVIIGWTGSHTTLTYLEDLEPILSKLQKKYHYKLKVIANKPPRFNDLDYEFIKWTEDTEINELLCINIGIMPLPDDEWTKGKCGFKAIQYMALGKPAIVSAVGVNEEIVDHGVNGFVCRNHEEWEKFLELLINNPDIIYKQGLEARKKIENFYSLNMAASMWCTVLSSAN